MTPKILITDFVDEEGIREVMEGRVELCFDNFLTMEKLLEVIPEYDGIIIRSRTRITREVIERGERLQVIGRAGIGVDNIDLEYATRKGIVVVNAPSGNIISTAEHTIALLFSLSRNIPQAYMSLKEGRWERERFMGREIRRKTLGILGLGRVGSEVARRAKALEMRVIAHDPFVSAEYAESLGVELVSREELFRESDFLTIHLPLTDSTRNCVGERELEMMKRDSFLINTSRGEIVDEEALLRALDEGKIRGAALDVFTREPPPKDDPLVNHPRVIATPHLGALTEEAQKMVAREIGEQVLLVLEGKSAKYAINAPFVPHELLKTLRPFMEVAEFIGKIGGQLHEGGMENILIKFDGEISGYNLEALKASIIKGMLEPFVEERINIVNAISVARARGIKIIEQRNPSCENYTSLITLDIDGKTIISGTTLRGEAHIVRVNDFWLDFKPTPGYWLFSDHKDRPGLIGAVGNITGRYNININSMLVGRLEPRGRAIMILGLDEQLPEEARREILAIEDIYTARVVII